MIGAIEFLILLTLAGTWFLTFIGRETKYTPHILVLNPIFMILTIIVASYLRDITL